MSIESWGRWGDAGWGFSCYGRSQIAFRTTSGCSQKFQENASATITSGGEFPMCTPRKTPGFATMNCLTVFGPDLMARSEARKIKTDGVPPVTPRRQKSTAEGHGDSVGCTIWVVLEYQCI